MATGGGTVHGTCHVVCAGPAEGFALAPRAGDLVVAADAGYLTCSRAGVAPDLVIGDFDSMDARVLDGASCERLTLPTAKDDTDAIASLRAGLARGYRIFELHCALGGDLGHTLANVQALLFLRDKGARGVLRGCGQDARAVFPEDGEVALCTHPGERVSVFAFAGDAHGVCERGLRWELDDAELRAGFPLGVSNEATGEQASFWVREGQLLVVIGSLGPNYPCRK